MKAIYKRLLDQSEQAAVAAIEVYNKPSFSYREESFIILLVNAWELLLKAKILKDTGKVRSLYVHYGPNNRKIKKARCGNPLTIDLFAAAKKLSLDQTVFDNIEMLTEVRDTCVHFHPTDDIKELVFNLGTAALRNYSTLMQEWFKRSLGKHHFYILPLGFSHGFSKFDGTGAAGVPKEVDRIIRATRERQQRAVTGSGNFVFACEIDLHLRSSKKYSGDAAATVKVDPTATEPTVIVQEKRKLDQYPYSYKELVSKVRERVPTVKQSQIDAIIRQDGLKRRSTYAAYSFLKKADENRYLTTGEVKKGTPSIYNHDAIEYIAQKLLSSM